MEILAYGGLYLYFVLLSFAPQVIVIFLLRILGKTKEKALISILNILIVIIILSPLVLFTGGGRLIEGWSFWHMVFVIITLLIIRPDIINIIKKKKNNEDITGFDMNRIVISGLFIITIVVISILAHSVDQVYLQNKLQRQQQSSPLHKAIQTTAVQPGTSCSSLTGVEYSTDCEYFTLQQTLNNSNISNDAYNRFKTVYGVTLAPESITQYGKIIQGINPKTMKVLGGNEFSHIKDQGKIYSLKAKEFLVDIDVDTFEFLTGNVSYARDINHIYYFYPQKELNYRMVTTQIDVNTFEIITGSNTMFAKDKNNIYYLNQRDYPYDLEVKKNINTITLQEMRNLQQEKERRINMPF